MAWNYNPAEYEEVSYEAIPVGDHRVRIGEVNFKHFKSGNDGYEIVLDVSGHGGKLWFYLVLDPTDTKKTNQRIGTFFDSFAITDYDLSHCNAWVGKIGGVRVKHEEYNGENKAKVAFCLARKNQDKLPPWKEVGMSAAAGPVQEIVDEDLPF